VPFTRDSFVIPDIGEVYTPAVLSGRLLLGAEAHFP
jgi:hypothetical protein